MFVAELNLRTDCARSDLKREAERKVERADRVAGAPIQIVTVLQPHRTDNALPADAAPDRIERRIRRIIPQVFGNSDGIHETDQRQRRRDELFQLGVAEQVRLGAQQVSIRVARRSFALLIAAHRVFATGKKTLRKREFPVRAAEMERRAMSQAEMQEKSTDQIRVVGASQLEALIIDLATQRGGGELDVAQQVVASGREQGVIAFVVPEIENNRAYSRLLHTRDRRGLIFERGQKLVVVTQTDIRVD